MPQLNTSTDISNLLRASDQKAMRDALGVLSSSESQVFLSDWIPKTYAFGDGFEMVGSNSDIIPDYFCYFQTLFYFWKIAENVTSIGSYAFAYCSGFTSELIIPDSVTDIGHFAFNLCSGFSGLTLSNSLTTIGSYAFYGCSGFSGELVIPSSVTNIGDAAFGSCTGVTSVTSLATVAPTLGSMAFYGVNTSEIYVPADATGYGVTWGGLTVLYEL